MVARRRGPVVEVTDGTADQDYRGTFFYDLARAGVIRAALAQAGDLRPHGVTALALTPGFLRSEAMPDHFGVTEATWRDGIAKDSCFAMPPGGSRGDDRAGRAGPPRALLGRYSGGG